MLKMKALILALLVFLVGGSAAFAQPLSDVATYTNWSLKHSVNPFYQDGRKGISEEEAARLPVGTLITLPDGTTHALKRGEYIWKLSREYALKVPLATRSTPLAASHVAKPKAAHTPPSAITRAPAAQPASDTLKEARDQIQARYEAERETARLAEEVNEIRMAAEGNLAIATGSMQSAFAATSKAETLRLAEGARDAADMARKNADEADRLAEDARRIANESGSDTARKTALSVRADADAASSAEAEAHKAAQRALQASSLWVMDWPRTLALAAVGLFVSYLLMPNLLFNFLPRVFNVLFKDGINGDGLLDTVVKVLATPSMLSFYLIDRESFYQRHYGYLYALSESADADEESTASPEATLGEDDSAFADTTPIEEELQFSVYPDDKRLEIHQLH